MPDVTGNTLISVGLSLNLLRGILRLNLDLRGNHIGIVLLSVGQGREPRQEGYGSQFVLVHVSGPQ